MRNDGYHAMGPNPEEAKALVERLREQRPDDDFVISLRVPWDVTSMEAGAMAEEANAYREAGIQNLHVAPDRGDIDGWLAGQEKVAMALLA